MVEVMKIMVTSFRRSHACTAALTASNPASGHHQPTLPPETLDTHRQVWVRFFFFFFFLFFSFFFFLFVVNLVIH